MNIDDLRQQLLAEMDAIIDRRVASLANIRYVPAGFALVSPGQPAQFQPGNNPDAIALQTCEITSEIRAFKAARAVINETINKLLSPVQQPAESEPDETSKELY